MPPVLMLSVRATIDDNLKPPTKRILNVCPHKNRTSPNFSLVCAVLYSRHFCEYVFFAFLAAIADTPKRLLGQKTDFWGNKDFWGKRHFCLKKQFDRLMMTQVYCRQGFGRKLSFAFEGCRVAAITSSLGSTVLSHSLSARNGAVLRILSTRFWGPQIRTLLLGCS